MNLEKLLPQIAPKAIEWATRYATRACDQGTPLVPSHAEIARRVGVAHAERIRILLVEEIPLPDDPVIRSAAAQVGLAGPDTAGLTLGYAVMIRPHHRNDVRLLSHEFRHVAQYEACGGIPQFLSVHLPHLVAFGYEDSPFEVDARAHEVRGG